MDDDDVLAQVVTAWRLSQTLHSFGDPIDEDRLLAAEARLGRPLPGELRRLCGFADGFDGFGGSLRVENALAAAGYADDLRDSDWEIAPELLVFGGNGSGDYWAIWYPETASPDDPLPVIEIGEITEGGNLAISGSSLARFLRTYTGFHLAHEGDQADASNALGLPDPLRVGSNRLAPFVTWSDPALPFTEPDPYVQRLTASDVRSLVAKL